MLTAIYFLVSPTYRLSFNEEKWLWQCLSYASSAEGEATRRKIIKLYTNAVRGEVKDWTDRNGKYYKIYRIVLFARISIAISIGFIAKTQLICAYFEGLK
jgi:hypothetical protein